MPLLPINGRDIGLAIQKTVGATATYVLIGCLTDSSFDVDTAADEASCLASGQFKEYIGGQTGFTLGGTLNVRQATAPEADTNVTAENLLDMQLVGDLIQVRYRLGSATGSAWYTGSALITKSAFKGQLKGIATYAVSLQGSGPLTKTLAPA